MLESPLWKNVHGFNHYSNDQDIADGLTKVHFFRMIQSLLFFVVENDLIVGC